MNSETSLDFCLDSGASMHLCSDYSAFIGFRLLQYPIIIYTVSSPVYINYVGWIKVKLPSGQTIILSDVIYLPNVPNILSMPQLLSLGASVFIQEQIANIFVRGYLIAIARQGPGNLFWIQLRVQPKCKALN